MKNPLKKLLKNQVPDGKPPRPAEEIKKEYYTLLAQAGEFQYQINVYTKTLANINVQLEQLNMEMAERQNLDKAAQAEAQAKAAKEAAEKAKEAAATKASEKVG